MTVSVTKTSGHTAEITWQPREDDPRGYIARAIEGGWLEDALTALGDEQGAGHRGDQEDGAVLGLLSRVARLRQLLERREQHLVVALREERGASWAQLADALYEDASRRSSAQRRYEAGVRQSGVPRG